METNQVPYSRVLGATLLISGCCIGAGMLGLPVLTALGGFRPTLVLFTLCWLFMASTGLLLLEVTLWFKEEVNIVTMAKTTLGPIGKYCGWLLFTFLFYSLMIAYVSGSGQLFADFVEETTGHMIPEWIGGLLLTTMFGILLYLGTYTVDLFNRLLMFGLIASYFVLVGMGSVHVKLDFLKHTDWGTAVYAIPTMIISFGFHNLIPSMTTYLKHDIKKLYFAIICGSVIPLFFYFMWEWLILGLIPVEGENGFRQALEHGEMTTRALRNAIGASWIVDLAEYFAFFAILTSFLSVALSFVDFLADGLKMKKDPKGTALLCLLTLGPPFVISMLYPKIFLVALSYSGAFGAVLLFGVLPASMVWAGRYVKKYESKPLLPGGKLTLVLLILSALGITLLELIHLIKG